MDTPDTEGQDSLQSPPTESPITPCHDKATPPDRATSGILERPKRAKRERVKKSGDRSTIAANREKHTGDHNRLFPDLQLDVVELDPNLANLPPRDLAVLILRNVGYSLSETCKALRLSMSQLCRILSAHKWTTGRGGAGLPRLPDSLVRAYRLSKYQRLETLAVDRTLEALPEASARDAAQIAERAATQLHLCRQPSLADQVSVYDIRAKLSQPNSIKKVIANSVSSDSSHVA